MDILLLQDLLASPLETLHQIPSIDFCRMLRFKLREQLLKLIQDAVLLLAINFLFVLPSVDPITELTRHEQGLKEAVHVTRRTNVGKALIPLCHS